VASIKPAQEHKYNTKHYKTQEQNSRETKKKKAEIIAAARKQEYK